MRDAIKSIVLAALALSVMGGCSKQQNPDQNVIITDNIPAGADIEAVPADEGGGNDEAIANAAESDAANLVNAD